ncbi:hypothetical protein Dimus_013292, partial [Dionaea muscipula]
VIQLGFDSVDAVLANIEPVDTDPVDMDPVNTDPVDTDPVDTEPVDIHIKLRCTFT